MAPEAQSNVTATLRDERGRALVVSKGHNVFTVEGKKWLAQLIGWATVAAPGADDVAKTKRRVRFMGVGATISQPATPDVTGLASTAVITSLTPSLITRPVVTSVKFSGSFTSLELPGTSTVYEAALYADYHNGATLEQVGGGPTIAYRVMDPPLTRTGTQVVTIEWEFRF